MKTALVHDWLVNISGSEKVLEAIYELYPGKIHTLVLDKTKIENSILSTADIETSFIQKLPLAKTKYRNYLMLFPTAIEQFDLSDYELIISSSHAVAKGVLTNSNQLHICYCHTPIRYAWDLYHFYIKESNLHKGLKGILAKLILHYIRMWDISSTNRVDYFIANSKYVAKRIKKIYRRDSTVIYPPVNVKEFEVCTQKENFYLTVSRLVPYKRIDLLVDAFSMLPKKKLIVIGEGPELKKLKRKAPKNVEFLGYQQLDTIKNYMKKAKAFLFAAEEDFGIAPVEAQACGTPVIAYGKGGTAETVVDKKTGILFPKQNVESIISAIKLFEKMEDKFDPFIIRENAERFSKDKFVEKFKSFVNKKLEEFF